MTTDGFWAPVSQIVTEINSSFCEIQNSNQKDSNHGMQWNIIGYIQGIDESTQRE